MQFVLFAVVALNVLTEALVSNIIEPQTFRWLISDQRYICIRGENL